MGFCMIGAVKRLKVTDYFKIAPRTRLIARRVAPPGRRRQGWVQARKGKRPGRVRGRGVLGRARLLPMKKPGRFGDRDQSALEKSPHQSSAAVTGNIDSNFTSASTSKAMVCGAWRRHSPWSSSSLFQWTQASQARVVVFVFILGKWIFHYEVRCPAGASKGCLRFSLNPMISSELRSVRNSLPRSGR